MSEAITETCQRVRGRLEQLLDRSLDRRGAERHAQRLQRFLDETTRPEPLGQSRDNGAHPLPGVCILGRGHQAQETTWSPYSPP